MRAFTLAVSVALGFATSLAPFHAAATAAEVPGAATLLTADQRRVDEAALALLQDAQVKAAREQVRAAWTAFPQFGTPDGKSQLDGAVDELVYAAVRAAVESGQPKPSILWTLTPPYSYGAVKVPGSRFAIDTPDRIYRATSVDPAAKYVIRGQRNTPPSEGDFRFEAANAALFTVSSLPGDQIDVAADGSFSITVDATLAEGKRNHLTLPATATNLLIRDTLKDWNGQLANRLSIERIAGPAPSLAPEQIRQAAIASIARSAATTGQFLKSIAAKAPNRLTPQVRGLDFGIPGAIIGFDPFTLADDEVLVLTIDGQGADYVGLELTDPWLRSIPYWNVTSSLSNAQAKANADGTITFILSPRDPGYFNWLSPNGLNTGVVAIRVENGAKADVARLVRTAKVVKLADLAAAVPAALARVTPAERAQQQRERATGIDTRLTR